MAFTDVALAAYLAAHGCVPLPAIDLIVAHAMTESHGDPDATHYNLNGTADCGLAQVNVINFHWTGLTWATCKDPCTNMLAGLKVAIAAYNGNGSDAQKIAYTNRVLSNMRVHAGKSSLADMAINSPQLPALPVPEEDINDQPAGTNDETQFNGE